MDRSDAAASRGTSCMSRLGRRDGISSERTPWETRFVCALGTFTKAHMEAKVSEVSTSNGAFVDWQEKHLNYTHENCQCPDTRRLRDGENFETVLMERVLNRIGAEVWEVIPLPSEDVWRNRGRFLTYFTDHLSGIGHDGSLWDYAYSRGEVSSSDKITLGPLPQGWKRRCEYANTVCYYNCHGRVISQDVNRPHPSNVPYHACDGSYTIDEEDLIEL